MDVSRVADQLVKDVVASVRHLQVVIRNLDSDKERQYASARQNSLADTFAKVINAQHDQYLANRRELQAALRQSVNFLNSQISFIGDSALDVNCGNWADAIEDDTSNYSEWFQAPLSETFSDYGQAGKARGDVGDSGVPSGLLLAQREAAPLSERAPTADLPGWLGANISHPDDLVPGAGAAAAHSRVSEEAALIDFDTPAQIPEHLLVQV